MTAVLVISAALVSYMLAGLARWVAVRYGIIDQPNQRSSHRVPTPRGGGIGIVIAVLAAAALQVSHGRVGLAVLVGGGAVAAIGWVDDVRTLSARLRFGIQSAAALFAVALVGPTASAAFPGSTALVWVVSVIFIVWMTNLYNFMDGIDGLAATEAFIAFGAAALLLYERAPQLGMVAAAASASSGAFLLWNWSPARIFMGDVGSGFLGFVFGVLALASEVQKAVPIEAWIVLLAVFIVDATATLIRRVLQGERWYSAHRTHAYQVAAQASDHARVTTAVALINLLLAGVVLYCARSGIDMGLPLAGTVTALLLVWHRIVRRSQPSGLSDQG